MIGGVIIVLLAVGAGVAWFLHDLRKDASNHAPKPGWVYFMTPFGGEVDDPPAPIKIGMTTRDPYNDRMPEIETMSPTPLQILYAIPAPDPAQLERAIHDHLAESRLHGEWFDRNATMAFIDYVQRGGEGSP